MASAVGEFMDWSVIKKTINFRYRDTTGPGVELCFSGTRSFF